MVERLGHDMEQIRKAYRRHHEEIDHVRNHEIHHEVADLWMTHQDDLFVFQLPEILYLLLKYDCFGLLTLI